MRGKSYQVDDQLGFIKDWLLLVVEVRAARGLPSFQSRVRFRDGRLEQNATSDIDCQTCTVSVDLDLFNGSFHVACFASKIQKTLIPGRRKMQPISLTILVVSSNNKSIILYLH